MNNRDFQDVTVIIRHAGERTLGTCRNLILDQGVPEEQIFLVNEVPFLKTIQKSITLGITEGRKWTFCVDADVLLRPGSIKTMVAFAEEQADRVCEVQGLVLDKFFGGPRPAGNHLFRTNLLPELIKRLPKEDEAIRPDHHTLKKMAESGFPFVQSSYVVGLHDEEQYYFDVYRKCFVQAIKHLHFSELMVSLWKRKAEADRDYQVALKAFSDSILKSEKVTINSQLRVFKEGFNLVGLSEKSQLGTNNFSLEDIQQRIQSWVVEPEYKKFFPDGFLEQGSTRVYGKLPFKERLTIIAKNRGVLFVIPFTIGKMFFFLGNKFSPKDY